MLFKTTECKFRSWKNCTSTFMLPMCKKSVENTTKMPNLSKTGWPDSQNTLTPININHFKQKHRTYTTAYTITAMSKTPLTNHTLKAIMTYKACNTYPTTMVKTTSQLLLTHLSRLPLAKHFYKYHQLTNPVGSSRDDLKKLLTSNLMIMSIWH